MVTGLGKASFCHIAKFDGIKNYMGRLKSDPRHQQITELALERMAPPQPTKKEEEASVTVRVLHGLGQFAGGAWKMVKGATKVVTGTREDLKVYGARKVEEKGQGARDRRCNEDYLKRQEKYGQLPGEAKEQLEALLQVDFIRPILVEIYALTDSLDKDRRVLGALFTTSDMDRIKDYIGKGEFKQARAEVQKLKRELTSNTSEDESCERLLRALEFPCNQVEQMKGETLAHDIEQLIMRSPLLQLNLIKGSLNRGNEAWKGALRALLKTIPEEDGELIEDLKEVEKLASESKKKEVIERIKSIERKLVKPMLEVLKECAKKDSEELTETICKKIDPEWKPENGVDNLDTKEKEAKEMLSALRASSRKDVGKSLLLALQKVKGGSNELYVREFAKQLQEQYLIDNLKKQAAVIDEMADKAKEDDPETGTLKALKNHMEKELKVVQGGSMEQLLSDAFSAILRGENPKESLLLLFSQLKNETDQMFFAEIADILEKGGEEGINQFHKDYVKQSSDEAGGSVPFHLGRILKFLVSEEGRKAVGNVAANRLMQAVMGSDFDVEKFEIDQTEFDKSMDAKLRVILQEVPGDGGDLSKLDQAFNAFTNWFLKEGGGAQQIVDVKLFGPVLEKIKGKEIEVVLREWFDPAKASGERKPMKNFDMLKERFLSAGGAAALAKVLLERYAKDINGGEVATKREETEKRLEEQQKQLKEGGKEMAEVALDFAFEQLKKDAPTLRTDADGNPILKKEETLLDATGFLFSDSKKEGKLFCLKKVGPVVVVVNEEDLKLAMRVIINQGLIEGGNLLKGAAEERGQDGYDFLCNIVQMAFGAMTYSFKNPSKDYPFKDKEVAKGLFRNTFGKDGAKIGFTPFIREIVMGIAAPGAVGAIPFKLLEKKAVGEELIEKIHERGLYGGLIDDLIVDKMGAEIDKLTEGRNIYDYMLGKKKGPPVEMTQKEELLSKQMNKLAYQILLKVNPDLAPDLKKHMNRIGEVMVPLLQNVIAREFGVDPKDLDQITPEKLYDYSLKKGAEALKKQMEDDKKKVELEDEKAKLSDQYATRLNELKKEVTALRKEWRDNAAAIDVKIKERSERILTLKTELKNTIDEYGARMKEDKDLRKELRKERELIKAEIAKKFSEATKEIATLKRELIRLNRAYEHRISELKNEKKAIEATKHAQKVEIDEKIAILKGEKTTKAAREYQGKIARFARPLLKKKSMTALVFGLINHLLKKIFIPFFWVIGKIVEYHCKVAGKDFTKTEWYKLRKRRGKALASEKLAPLEKMLTKERVWKRIYGTIIDEYKLATEPKEPEASVAP